MAEKQLSFGVCTYCNETINSSEIIKHLSSCLKRKEVITKADSKAGVPEKLYHLHVEDAYAAEFWLELEMKGSSTLKELDKYLKAIWLECCGHMSQFSLGGEYGQKIAMTHQIMNMLEKGKTLTHVYDFGDTSTTLIKIKTIREGNPTTAKPIALMARNILPQTKCMECGEQAEYLCMECVLEENKSGLLCETHTEDHPHNDYDEPNKIVNSPRLGLCGYDGPAEPPY